MILVDTSVWVEHMRRGNAALGDLLADRQVATHPFVVGELVLGGAVRKLIDDLRDIPQLMVATDDEVLGFIDRYGLVGSRVGYLDVHLLASTRLAGDSRIWTLDKSMQSVAARLGIAANPVN